MKRNLSSVEHHYKLTTRQECELPQQIATLLQGYCGAEHAITAQSIAHCLGLSGRDADRKVRVAIGILLERGFPIGASVGKPAGFYSIATEAEARRYLDDLRTRVTGIWKRYDNFAKAAKKHFGIRVEQLKLW